MSQSYKQQLIELESDLRELYKLEPQSIKPSGVDYSKPKQYQIGIDTFERAKATMSRDELIGFCKGNVDKYCWRVKGCDKEDLAKAKDYIDLWIWTLDNKKES